MTNKRRIRKVKSSSKEPLWNQIWIPGETIIGGRPHWVQRGYLNTDTNVYCCKCGKHMRMTDSYADLDGESFRSYYCKFCKESQGYY